MLSGIGPAATLAKHNIPLRVDLPGVGANMQDHFWFSSQYRVLVPTASAGINDASNLAVSRQLYEDSASGPLTIPAPGFLAWEKAKNVSWASRQAIDEETTIDWPDLEHIPIAAALGYQRNYQKEDPSKKIPWTHTSSVLEKCMLIPSLHSGRLQLRLPRHYPRRPALPRLHLHILRLRC